MDLKICERKTIELINQYVPDWGFQYDKAKLRFGCTHYRTKKITLSSTLVSLNDWDTVRLTVLHEIAHAIVGFRHHHDYMWRQKCIEIGGDGKRCYSTDNVNIAPAYVAICPKCGHKSFRQRKPRGERSCGACCNVFSRDRILNYVKQDDRTFPEPVREEKNGQLGFVW